MELFERNTYSVVNIFDVTLRPQVNMTGSVEVLLSNVSLTFLFIFSFFFSKQIKEFQLQMKSAKKPSQLRPKGVSNM